MSIGLQGQNLIFLVSQPRAGSTLLQRILGSHPDIHTVSEPWLMLHPLYALRPDGYQAEYGEHLARVAVQGFLQMLPDGEDEFFEGLRRMHSYLYKRALASSDKRHFLDKTPRYYLILPELYRIFPKAHYLILWRNPLAVLCSGLRTWTKERWLSLHNHKHDLIEAPRLLLAGIDKLGERGTVVHYEQLVRHPEDEVRRICDRLGVDFVPGMIEYGRHDLPRWRLGDQGKVYQHTRPASRNEEKWVQALEDPQIWRLAHDYLQLLGQETVEQMGYPYEKLLQILQTHRPHRVSLQFTFSLAWLLEKPAKERNTWDRLVVRLARSLQGRGSRGAVVAAVRKVTHALSNPE